MVERKKRDGGEGEGEEVKRPMSKMWDLCVFSGGNHWEEEEEKKNEEEE